MHLGYPLWDRNTIKKSHLFTPSQKILPHKTRMRWAHWSEMEKGTLPLLEEKKKVEWAVGIVK